MNAAQPGSRRTVGLALSLLLAAATVLGCSEGTSGASGSEGEAGASGSGGESGASGSAGGPGSLTPPPPDNPTDARRLDLRDFQSFRIAQTDGLGECPDRAQVDSARIDRIGDDQFQLAFATLLTQAEFDSCVEEMADDTSCYESVPGEPRTLTDFDIIQLEGVFASLTVHFAPDPVCDEVALDPCRIIVLQWDDLQASDYECGAPWISQVFAVGILERVTDIALPPE